MPTPESFNPDEFLSKIEFYFSTEDLDKLKAISEKEGIPLQELYEQAITLYLALRNNRATEGEI